jgi:hypothetical protein
MKKLLFRLIIFLSIVVFLVLVNFWVDPGQMFRGEEYEAGIASILLSGMNVANLAEYDGRLVQKFYIQGLSSRKDIVVLGSSRSCVIGSEMFPGRTFFNNWVSGATIEDYLAIYEMYREKGILPSRIILGLDPWVLNRNHEEIRWKVLWEYYAAASRRIVKSVPAYERSLIPNKYFALLSPAYFQRSFWVLLRTALSRSALATGNYYATHEKELDVSVRFSDGSNRYDRKGRDLSVTEVNRAAEAYVDRGSVYGLERFYSLDGEYRETLERFLALLRKDGVEPMMFLPPYHPYVYHALTSSAQYRVIMEVQRYFENLAKETGVKLVGSYNPTDLALGEEEFFDGAHPRPSALEKLFRSLR